MAAYIMMEIDYENTKKDFSKKNRYKYISPVTVGMEALLTHTIYPMYTVPTFLSYSLAALMPVLFQNIIFQQSWRNHWKEPLIAF